MGNAMRVLDYAGLVPVCEPVDHQAGIEFDSFALDKHSHADICVTFGAITGDSILTVYAGATAGAKTTAIPFRHRLSAGDFKAASADQYAAADTTDADGALTLTAATYDHRVLVIMLDAAELPEAKPWVTVDVDGTASVLLMAGVAVLSGPRYGGPSLTAIA